MNTSTRLPKIEQPIHPLHPRADLLARQVVEALVSNGGSVLIEQYKGQDDVFVTIGGEPVSEARSSDTSVSWQTSDLGSLERFGQALIEAARMARSIGLGA
jgi:hypothetical protein